MDTRTAGYLESTRALGGHSGTWRALRLLEGTWTLGYLRDLRTRTLRSLRHFSTWALKALRHLDTQAIGNLEHLDTQGTRALGHLSTQGTLFSRLSGKLLDKLTDHLPYFVLIENMNNKPSKQKIKMRDTTHFTLDKYLANLKDLDSVLQQECSNVDDMYNIYQDRLVEIIDKNSPFKVLSNNELKLKLKPWITPHILKSIKTKNKIYGKFLRSRKKFWFDRYKYYRNMVINLIHKSKKKHLRHYFQENFSNTKTVWSKINEILQHNKKKSDNIFLDINGETVSNHMSVTNEFKKFINVAQNLLKDLGDTNNQFQDYLKNLNEHSLFLKETEPEEAFKILRELNAKKDTDVH